MSTTTCARCRGPDPLPLSGLCATCSKKRADAIDTARLFNHSPVRNRGGTMRKTIRSAAEVRDPDDNDRHKCGTCQMLILDGFEKAHAQKHLDKREGSWPIRFTPSPAQPRKAPDPADRSGGGIQYGPTTQEIKEI